MGAKYFVVLTFALGIVMATQGQYYGRMRGLNSIYKDSCTCTCEDIASLIALARVLEEKELTPPPPPPSYNPTPCLSNFEDLIMKLVNALVYTTTETTKNACCCSNSVSNKNCGGSEMTTSSSTYYPQSDGGLINVDVLNKNKNSNVLDVDVGSQQVVGVGLGGGTPPGQSSTGQKPSGQYGNNPNSGEGLINLDLLNPNNPNNVAELDLGKQKVLGVGLGGGGDESGGVPKPNSGYKKNPPNSGEGLINLDLLNPKNENNVADLDLGGKTLVGVGLGN